MDFVKAAKLSDLPPGGKLKVSLLHKEILLTNVDNLIYAIDNRCSHMGGSLFDGKLNGDLAICPKHGSVFNVKTGKVVQAGKIFHISVGVEDLHNYPVNIEGDDILIGID